MSGAGALSGSVRALDAAALGMEAVAESASAKGARAGERLAFLRFQPRDISPPGHALSVSWAGAPGATDAEVTAAPLTLAPDEVVHAQADLPLTAAGDHADVALPAHERLRSLHLHQLRLDDETDLLDEGGLAAKGVRLTVSLHDGKAFGPPQHAVPAVSGGAMMPAILGGASFSGGVLKLPDVVATKVRLHLVQGDTPTEFAPQPMSLSAASGVTVLESRGVSVTGPDGSAVFSMPEELPDVRGGHAADLRHALQQAFQAALKAGQPLSATFRVKGEAGCSVLLAQGPVRGALLRTEHGVLTTQVQGAPAALQLSGPLAPSAPSSATGDLSVTYLGLRVLLPFSDEVPPFGGTGGIVVRETPVLRPLPSAALAGPPLARVGIIGRAPERCELSLQLVEDAGGGQAGKALGAPATLKLDPAAQDGAELQCHWIELPAPPATAGRGPVALALRATSGRFLWAAGERPRVRLAVADPDPGGRPLHLGGATLLAVHDGKSHAAGFAFPAARFAAGAGNSAGAGPVLDSELFLAVDISDLTLRYAR